jgi:MYXO-CTERM domain-containing protein
VYNIGDPASMAATRIGFWLQARVAQTEGENWGVIRASSGDTTSYIQLIDQTHQLTLTRGTTNAANTAYGRGSGYRNGGANTGNTGNSAGSLPFPDTTGNENGGIDQGAGGARIYGFNAWVGATRSAANPDDPSQPWNVNGALGAGSPIPSDGTFSPWASVYRVWLDVPAGWHQVGVVTIEASALLTGAATAAPVDPSLTTWEMVEGGSAMVTASYAFSSPSPGGAGLAMVGAAWASRRRRG